MSIITFDKPTDAVTTLQSESETNISQLWAGKTQKHQQRQHSVIVITTISKY